MTVPSLRANQRQADASALRVDPSIPIPAQRTMVVRAPRGRSPELDVSVQPVPGAAGYQFEIVVPPSTKVVRYGSIESTLTFRDIGNAKSGRWRVASIRDGLRSRLSPWQRFVVRG